MLKVKCGWGQQRDIPCRLSESESSPKVEEDTLTNQKGLGYVDGYATMEQMTAREWNYFNLGLRAMQFGLAGTQSPKQAG